MRSRLLASTILVAVAIGAPVLMAQSLPAPSFSRIVAGAVDATTVLGRAMGVRAAERLDALDFILGQADATAGINTALAKANNRGAAVVDLPCGYYVISGPLVANTTGLGSVKLHGAGSNCTTIVQTVDADGIDVTVGNYGSNFLGGGFHADGFTLEMAAPTTAGRTAMKVTTNATTGNTGVPIDLDDISVSSPNTAGWAIGFDVSGVSNVAYLSRLSTVFNGHNGVGLHLSGSAQTYSASVYVRDSTMIGGAIGYQLGDYLQGIHIDNPNTINTVYALYAVPTAQGSVDTEIQIHHAYLDGKVLIDGTTSPFNSVDIDGYINSDLLQPGDAHVHIKNVPAYHLHDSVLNGPVNSVANVIALLIEGANSYGTKVSGTLVQAYGIGGTAFSVGAGVNGAMFYGDTSINNSVDLVDDGTSTSFTSMYWGGNGYYPFGQPNVIASTIMHVAPRIDGPTQIQGLLSANAGANVSGGNLNVLGEVNHSALQGAGTGQSPATVTYGGDTNIGYLFSLKGSGALISSGPLQSAHYTFAQLPPAGTLGRYAYCVDCLRPGQTTGSGSGMLVFDDGSSWISAAGTAASR